MVTVLTLLIAGTATLAWFSHTYQKNLKTKISGWVAEATDSIYTAEVSDVRLSIMDRHLVATNIRLIPDLPRIQRLQQQGVGSNQYYEINIPKLTATGIKWTGLLGEKEISCKQLVLQRPRLTITRPYNFRNNKGKVGSDKGTEPKIKKLHTDAIKINDVTVVYRYISPSDTSYLYLEKGNIALNNWTFEPAAPEAPEAFMLAKNGQVSFESIRHRQGINLYKFVCGQIQFSSEGKALTIKDLLIEPTLSNEDFYKRVGKRVEIFRLKVPILTIDGLRWNRLLNHGEIIADNLSVSNATLRVYYSLLLPTSNTPKIGMFPQQILQKMGVPVDIATVRLQRALVTYTEISPLTKRSGTLVFNDINGNISNVTNMPSRVRSNQYAVADVAGKLNRGAEIKAKFNFYLADSSGSFTVSGHAKNIQGPQIDEPSQALALTEIKSLQVDSIAMEITGNERASKGYFTMLYHDLKIGIQKIDKETGEAKNKGFSSFIANKALLYPENPEPGQQPRTATSYVMRKPSAGFFNIIWKNIFQGAANTVGRNEELVKLVE